VSPIIMFSRLITKSPSAFSNSQIILKNLAVAFWHQKSPNELTLKLYILCSCCPEEEPHLRYKLIVY
jgi:hypothetical protein